jgi:recombination protein RecT
MANLDLSKPNNAPATAPAPQKAVGLAAVIRSKIANTLAGQKGEQFVTDVVTLVNNNPALGQCDQVSLIASCLQAQTLNLSLNRQMGQAWIVPFKDRKNNRTTATFQIGYRGLVQLAIRSGQYRKLNVLAVKDGELVRWNPLEEEITIELIEDESARAKARTIGYYAMFEYLNGFRKAMYWSVEKMHTHAVQYSQSYAYDLKSGKKDSFWSKDFDSMAIKTMLRQLISKWGIMSTDMQTALAADGRTDSGYVEGGEVLDVNFTDAQDQPESTDTGEVIEAEPVKMEQPEPQPLCDACPNDPETRPTKAWCDGCKDRKGCPCWE